MCVSRIHNAEILLRRNRAAVLQRFEIKIDQLVNRAAMQKAKHLAQGQRSSDGADEGRADGLAGEQRDAAAIERSAPSMPWYAGRSST